MNMFESIKKIDAESEKEIKIIQDLDKSHQIEKLMDMYHSGNQELVQLAQQQMLDLLQGLIQHFINHYYYQCSQDDRDDMVQEASMNILVAMQNYDPSKASPTTYFKFHILDGIKKSHNNAESETAYNAQLKKRIRQLISSLNTQNIEYDEEQITQVILLKYSSSNYSPDTVRGCYRDVCAQVQQIAYENADNNTQEKEIGIFETPEKTFLKKEENGNLYQANDSLPREERYTIALSMGLYQTDKDILSEILHTYTQYSPLELCIANGMKPIQALRSFGLTKIEILSLYGVSSSDAEYFFAHQKDKEDKKVLSIYKKLHSITTTFRENMMYDNLRKILLKNGNHTAAEVEEILSGARCQKNLKPVSELSWKELLTGKGLTNVDFEKIVNSKPLSNAKIAPLLNLKQNEVNSISTKAMNKLKRTLKNTNTLHSTEKDVFDSALSRTDMKLQNEIHQYVQSYYEALSECNMDEITLD